MKMYHVVETVPYYAYAVYAEGFYSSLEKAQKAILVRIACNKSPEEVTKYNFSDDGKVCTTYEGEESERFQYTIYEHELDEEIM